MTIQFLTQKQLNQKNNSKKMATKKEEKKTNSTDSSNKVTKHDKQCAFIQWKKLE